jgi:methyl-accepting chemotaxis protein
MIKRASKGHSAGSKPANVKASANKRTGAGDSARANESAEMKAQLAAITRVMAVISFDLTGTILDVNDNFLSVMGYRREEVVGQKHSMFVEPAFAKSEEYHQFWKDLQAGRPNVATSRRLAKGGKEVVLQASYNPILDSSGKPYKVVKYASDLTEQTRLAAETKAQMTAIDRSMAVISFDLTGTILEANDNFLSAMGYRREEIVGQKHSMFVEPTFAKSDAYRDFWDDLRAGKANVATFRRLGKGGKEVLLQASYNPIFDQQGKPYKVVKYASDLTEQTRAAAEAERQRLETILAESLRAKSALDNSATPIMMSDEKFVVVYMNETMRQLLTRHEAAIQRELPNFRVNEIVGNSIDRFHRSPHVQRQRLQAMTAATKVRLPLGGRLLEQVVVPARDPAGKVLGYSVAWEDQTDQVNAQKDVEMLLKAAIDGDLTHRLDVARYEGFVGQVAQGMNQLLDSVSDAFRQVRGAVEQIGQAAQELRSTSQMMSSSSVELNRAAQESSSSLARATEMVRANSESAAMANQLVSETSSAAQGGQSRMNDMSSAMGEINGSAQQIAKIIKVIDEIAFQTNLLALNAAVEAARAGRHGKGFAVVAQEVRNLAERSAKAAKETAQLIEDSVAKVAQGVRIADDTRGALDAIINNVAKVVDLAGEIASASSEQARTLDTVSGSMGQVTENAQAGSQQSNQVAAAAEEMGRQMELLKQRLEAYKFREASVSDELPAGLTPELVERLMAMLAARSKLPAGASRTHNDNSAAKQLAGGPPATRVAPAGDPRALLPLDRDERGFGGF